MKIAIVGGGPGGLYLAALMKQRNPAHRITLWERNAASDTFGFGVVFSDETLGGIGKADPAVAHDLNRRFARWSDIGIHFKGQISTVAAPEFNAIGRTELLDSMQRRALELGVDIRFAAMAPPADELADNHDLVVAADGANSHIRATHADAFKPSLDVRPNKYMWLGTDKAFEAFTFIGKDTEWGVMAIHGYPYSSEGSTFIVEMSPDVWHAAGFDGAANHVFAPGDSDEGAIAKIRTIFAGELRGHHVMGNNSRWLNFITVRNKSWRNGNVVLLGDAAHTAHFSIGFGTKLAMEDALELADCLHEHAEVTAALQAYEAVRQPVVEATQRAAQASMEWFENIEKHKDQDPAQFCSNLLTRSRPHRL